MDSLSQRLSTRSFIRLAEVSDAKRHRLQQRKLKTEESVLQVPDIGGGQKRL